MSLISNIYQYEELARNFTLAHLTSQFSGVLLLDYRGNLFGEVSYDADNCAASFTVVESSSSAPTIVKKVCRAWALPGYILEGIRPPKLDPGIQLPTLPEGAVQGKPNDIVLITTIPRYWYPSVPNGDALKSYDLRFDVPFLEVKNNRQYFKVAQTNTLEESTIAIQLSNIPAKDVSLTSSGTEVSLLR